MSAVELTKAHYTAPANPGGSGLLMVSGLVFLIGVVTLVYQLVADPESFPWGIFLSNFMFILGLTQFGVCFSAIMRLSRARWARPFYRVAEVMTLAFCPFAIMVFLLIFLFGKEQLLFWMTPAEGEHLSPWLNSQFLMIRNLVAQLVFYGITFAYFLMGLMPDVTDEPARSGSSLRQGFYRWVLSLKAGRDVARMKANMYLWAPVVLISCAIANTFVAWDFGMMLVPHYHSSVYAMLFIHGNNFGGTAAVLLSGVLLMRVAGGREFFGIDQLRCMGILITGFALFWIYLFWAQYFVTWFGNLPRESDVISAKMYGHYAPYFWTMMICLIGIPIGTLIFARTKRMWWSMITLSTIIVIGIWINRYLMVLPALEEGHVPFSAWQELILVIGLIAGFLFLFLLLVRALPMISNWEIQDAGSEQPAY